MMKIFLVICLASGLASSEKLDRSYLPPPGSKFSGGTPGDIETPLEFPKQPTRPLPGNGKPEIELGINRRPAPPAGPPDSQKPGFNYFQKSYPVPKTTTSYAITQTTTFSPDDEYTGINQPNGFLNGSTVQSSSPGQNQPIRRPGQGLYNQNRPGQGPSTVVPNGTTARPQFPGVFNGPEYLPPVNNNQSPTQVISDLDGFGYPSGLPQGSFEAVSANENQYIGNPKIPSNVSPSYQSGRFVPSGPGSQQPQNHFPGSQFPSSTTALQYQDGQRLITPGSNQQNQFIGSQFPSSTAAPQYQDGQRLITPGSNQQSQFSSNQGFPTSTAAPQYQDGQTLITPGSIQHSQFSSNQGFPTSTAAPQYQFGQRFTTPAQQNLFPGNQYLGNKNFPSSSSAPTSGLNGQSQFTGNHNHPSTAMPNYPNGQRFTTPGHTQGALNPSQPDLGSPESQNQFAGQNFPSTPSAPQFQDGVRLTTPGYVQEGYGSPVFTQQNQNQYPGNQNYPSSTTPQYQNGQQFITRGPIDNQNFPSTAAPSYQGGQRFTTPGQYEGQYIPEQQISGSRIPSQQSQSRFPGNLNYPSSTTSPQYQDDKRFSTPGSQESFDSAQSNQQNQYPVNQNFPTSTAAPQYQDGQRFSTPGSTQTFGSSQGNLGGNQNYPTSTVPQYQGQRITTPGQLFNQSSYSGSTTAPQYQQTLAPPPGQQGVIPNQQDQFQRPVFNQQFPSSTGAPQGYPGSLPQYGNNNIPSPGTNVAFPDPQGRPGGTIYGNIQQPTSQTGVGSPVFGAGPGFPSTTVGSLPGRDFTSTSGGPIGGSRAGQRPQAEGDRNAEILNYENVLTPEGYFYTYDTSNGIHADETGTVGNGTRAQGGYSYTGDDGKVYSVVYSADENGFQPRGDHLPTPPPIPEAIQRVIDQANRDKESGIDDDGSYNDQKYGYMKYEGPLTQLRPRNRTVSVVNGVEIPVMKEMAKPKGRKPVSNIENGEVFESVYEETDVNGSEADEVDDNENRRVDNLENSKEKNRRIGSKPIKTLTSEDNRQDKLKGMKMPVKPTTNSKTIERNGLDRRPISSEQNEDGASDDNTEESEDNDDLQEPQGLDYDADLVNYRDDPNNRTNFHGLNKYLPESKKTNRKNKPSKKHPTVRINGTKQSTGVNEPKTSEDRKGEGLEDSRPDFVDETRTRIPSRKNKIGQRVKDQSKVTGQSVSDSDDETNSYGDDRTDTGEEHSSDDATKLVTSDRVSIPGTTQSKKKIAGKPKRPNGNERTDMSDKKEIKPNEDNGYDYNPPQRKFGSEEAINLPSMVNQKGAQTTLRPFLTKNVYGDDTEPSDDYDGEYGAENPGRPMSGQKTSGYSPNGSSYNQNNPKFSTTKRPGTSRPFGRPETTEDSYIQNNPEVNDEQVFSTTRRPISYGTSRPFGRPQTTGDSYIQNNPEGNEEQGFSTTRRPISYGTSRPFGRPQTTVDSYNQKYPEVKEEQGFSTTRKPVSYGTSRPFGRPQTTIDSYNQNNPDINDDERFSTTRRPVSHGTSRPFGRPQNTDTPQYQEQGVTGQVYNEPTIQPQRPGDNTPNRGTGGNVFSSSTPLPSEPGYKYQRPGYQNRPTGYDTTPGKTYGANMPGQVPSTTNRPNYSFGDKISTPVTVDAFGRPIQSTNAPFDSTLRPTYSTGRPNESGSRPSDGDQFRPTDGRFGVTSTQGTPGYQSTSAPIGEDFSGPKQLQRFDPKTGYHYK